MYFAATAFALVHPPAMSVLGEYFSKKRGMANAIAYSGASIGNLVFAPVWTALFDEYGYTGTMLFAAGISLNACVSGALMRPVDSFRNGGTLDTERFKEEEITQLQNEKVNIELYKDNTLLNSQDIKQDNSYSKCESEKWLNSNVKETGIPLNGLSCKRKKTEWKEVMHFSSLKDVHLTPENLTAKRSHSAHQLVYNSNSNVSIYTDTSGFCGSTVDIKVTSEYSLNQTKDDYIESNKSLYKIFKDNMLQLLDLFDIRLLKSPVFCFFMCMSFLLSSSNMIVMVLFAPYARDLGLPKTKIGVLLSVVGCFDLFGRVVLAILADRTFINRAFILGAAAIIVGLMANCIRFFTNFTALIGCAVIIGKYNQKS